MKKNTERIVQLAHEKANIKLKLVIDAIDRLKSQNVDITFTRIANEANVSRNYLYKNKELRQIIDSLRKSSMKTTQPKDTKDLIIESQKHRINELQKQLIKYSLYDELVEKYKKLLAENDELNKRLKKQHKHL